MFILSSNPLLEPELQDFDRLYAYPREPIFSNNNKMIILDSGAFGLSMANKKMDATYIKNLGLHYLRFMTENTYCIAPDVFKFPTLSMKQYEQFKRMYPLLDVAPVIQFTEPVADIFSAKKQIKFYSGLCKPKMICVSNHKFDIQKQMNALKRICNFIYKAFGDVKIHALGAGFNCRDVGEWMKTGITSMDSISYYTDAQYKLKWIAGSSCVEPSNLSFKELALHNAKLATQAAQAQ